MERYRKGWTYMLYCYAKLTDEQLSRVKAFEAETGKKALVLRRVPVKPEDLAPDEITKLEALESELGMVVVVVK